MRKLVLLGAFFVVCLSGAAAAQDKKEMDAKLTELEFLKDDGITGETKDKILRHIRENLPAQTVALILADGGEKDLIVNEASRAPFAETVKIYDLRHRAFPHWSETYVEYKGKFYTSLRKEDFESFLKDCDFLKQSDPLGAFLTAYRNFYIKSAAIHPDYLVDEEYKQKNRASLERYAAGKPKLAFEKLHAPKAEKEGDAAGGIEISFFVDNPTQGKAARVEVEISPDYAFDWETKNYQRQ